MGGKGLCAWGPDPRCSHWAGWPDGEGPCLQPDPQDSRLCCHVLLCGCDLGTAFPFFTVENVFVVCEHAMKFKCPSPQFCGDTACHSLTCCPRAAVTETSWLQSLKCSLGSLTDTGPGSDAGETPVGTCRVTRQTDIQAAGKRPSRDNSQGG